MDQQDLDARLSEAPAFDSAAALERFRDRVARDGIAPRPSLVTSLGARMTFTRSTWVRPAIAAVAVLLIAGGATVTGVAETILTIFEPKQVATIQVDPTQLRGVPDPSAYGTLTWIAQPAFREVADVAAAAAGAGFTPLVPSALPASVPAGPRYAVMGEGKATFRFDEAKAREAAAAVNATLPPMPPAIAQTTLTFTGGPAILEQYGRATSPSTGGTSVTGTPALVIVQAKAPVVTSNGATVEELRDYALKQPGIPPSVAAQIRAIGDPVRTLLVPVGIDLKDARLVNVRGTQGYLVGDSTGLGSGIVWLERGYVIAAFGSLTDAELVALVNGLR